MRPILLPTRRLARPARGASRPRFALAAIAALAAVALVAAATPIAGAHNNAHPDKPAFGSNVHGMTHLKKQGVQPAYGLIWATEKEASNGFPTVKKHLYSARAAGVTPVIQWYYWGDSISVNCIKYGCHGKSRGEWTSYAYKLAGTIKSIMGDRLTIVVLETEFNKNGVQWYEDFDGLLKSQSWIFRNKGSNMHTAIGFGNWADQHWSRFDRAIGSVHYLGIQEISSAYRDSTSTMLSSAEKVIAGGKKLHDRFGKRVLVTDFAISTWKGKEWVQTREVKDIVWQKSKLTNAGIVGVIYRWVKDVPQMGWGHHGYAEKYWGLQKSDGSWKPAFKQWVWGTKGGPSAWTAYKG